jgi:hypothetical protein
VLLLHGETPAERRAFPHTGTLLNGNNRGAEQPTPAAASRGISNRVRGRSPGLKVLMRRLPGKLFPSGKSTHPHFLTVAGAAQALPAEAGAPVSRFTRTPDIDWGGRAPQTAAILAQF